MRRHVPLAALNRIAIMLVVTAAAWLAVAFLWPRHSDAAALRAMLRTLAPGRYDPARAYVGPVDETSLHPPKTALGSDGVLRVHYPGIGYRANPVMAAQYGLHAYDLWLQDHGSAERDRCAGRQLARPAAVW